MNGQQSPVGVLLIARELTLGGSERQLCEMAKALDPRRFEVHVASFRPGGIRAGDLKAAGIPILDLSLRSFRSPRSLWASLRALRRYIREHRIRIVHGFDPPSCLLIGFAIAWLRPAVVLTSQRNYQQARTALVRLGMRVSHRLADGIVVNCDAMRTHLLRDEHLSARRIHLCHNGLDITRFRRMVVPREGRVPEGAIVVGTLCALRPEKNLSVLIEAFAVCLATQPHLFLLVVGSGPERDRLQAEASARGISGRCRFEPTAGDVVPWLNLMDVFVLPSRFEALPNALMEAMACGCAVVASRVGGTPELVSTDTGLLFDHGDVPALVRHVMALVADPAMRERLGARAAARMAGSFSLEAAAQRMGAIYDERLAVTGSR